MKIRKSNNKDLSTLAQLSIESNKKTVEMIDILVNSLKKKNRELKFDRICGHWVENGTDRTATIIKSDKGYLVSLFKDEAFDEQLSVVSVGKRLCVEQLPEKNNNKVYLVDSDKRLIIRGHGVYIRDHILGYTSNISIDIKRKNQSK
jgi:hypothetical protein